MSCIIYRRPKCHLGISADRKVSRICCIFSFLWRGTGGISCWFAGLPRAQQLNLGICSGRPPGKTIGSTSTLLAIFSATSLAVYLMNFLRIARLFNQGFDRHRHRALWSLCLRCSRRICLDLWYPGSGHGLTRVAPLSSCMAVNRLRLSSTLQSSNEHHGLHGLLVSRIGTYIRRLSPPCTGDNLWFADVLDDSKHTDGTFLFVFLHRSARNFQH